MIDFLVRIDNFTSVICRWQALLMYFLGNSVSLDFKLA